MKKLLVLMFLVVASGCGMEQVDEGFRGVKTNLGKVEGEPLTPGMHFYNPFTSDIFEMKVREVKHEGEESCFTADTQTVHIKYAVTYYPNPEKINAIYSQFGKEWDEVVVLPAVQSALKDSLGKLKADDLVSKRDQATQDAFNEVKKSLKDRNVIVTRLDLTNLDFNDEYEKAVEAKVVAVQKASEAKNKTVEVKEESDQLVLRAKAEAESMRIRSQALSQNKNLIMYEAVQKWDGRYPGVMLGNGAMPILDLRKVAEQ